MLSLSVDPGKGRQVVPLARFPGEQLRQGGSDVCDPIEKPR